MATRRERLETELVATDKASRVIQDVAQEAKDLDALTPEVELTADDKASDEVRDLMGRINSLTDDEKKVILTAESNKLRNEVRRATILLGRVDGEEAEAILDAKDQASAKLDRVDSELDELDRRTADATIDVVGTGGQSVGDIADALGSGPQGVLGLLRNLGPAGVAGAGFIGMLAAAGREAFDTALEVDQIARFTGTSTEEASRLTAVLRDETSVEMGDLLDIIAQMQGVLADNPELARQLGVEMDIVRSNPLQAFIDAVEGLSGNQLSANEKILIGSKLFGEEGVRQVNQIIAAVADEGGLQAAIDAVSDSRIISPEDVRRAREFQEQFSDALGAIKGIALDLGGPLLDIFGPLIGAAQQAGNLIGKALEPAADLISGEQLGLGELGAEFSSFAALVGTGRDALEAWQLVFGDSTGFDIFQDNIENVNRMVDDGIPLLDAMAEVFGVNRDEALQLADQLGILEDATEDVTGEAESYQDRLKRLRDETEKNIDASEEYIDAVRGLGDTFLDSREADRRFAEQAERTNGVLNDGEAAARDKEAAVDDLIRAALGAADAEVEEARAAAEARGATLGHTRAIDIQNGALLRMAQRLHGPARTQLLDHIARINDIPDDVLTEIKAAVDRGDTDEAERLIDHASRPRTAAVKADSDIATLRNVKFQLDTVAQDQTATITAVAHTADADRELNQLGRARRVAFIGDMLPRAAGDPFTQQGDFLVGEQGPERIRLPRGSQITPNHRLDTDDDQRPVVNHFVTNNFPVGTSPIRTARDQRRYLRYRGVI